MRDRKQPFKGLESGYHAAETTVVVQSFVPSDSGYYSERFDLLKVCLASIVAHTDSEYDLMVIDNGSAPIVTKYLNELQRQGVIQYLVLNWRNLGLGGSLNIALNAAPGKYIAFSNDDVFYYPNWLSAHIRILETFPEAGLVSGLLISGPDRQDESILALADDETHVSEFYLPEEWIESFARSIGLTIAQFSNDPIRARNRNTYLVERRGHKAFAGKTGFSHLFRKEILSSLSSFPFETGLFAGDGVDRKFAMAIRDAGFVWLSTYDKLTAHLGNKLDDAWLAKLKHYRIEADIDVKVQKRYNINWNKASRLFAPIQHRVNSRTRKFIRHPRSQIIIDWMISKLINMRHN